MNHPKQHHEQNARHEDHTGCSGDTPCGHGQGGEHGERFDDFLEQMQLEQSLQRIGRRLIVLSGKGGVGKSTVAVNLAVALAQAGRRVGLLDIDIHGPSIPTMLGIGPADFVQKGNRMIPVEVEGLKVISIGLMLQSPDTAVIWRGPLKMTMIKQFLKDVEWGDLDDLVIDAPPGTGDEPLSICQLIGSPSTAVIVTTPQRVAEIDVRKSISFCRHLQVPVLGVVENMSGFACPHCGKLTDILPAGGGGRISEDMDVPFLGSIPIDPQVAVAGDEGRAFIKHFAATATARAMRSIIAPLLTENTATPGLAPTEGKLGSEKSSMRVAIPLAEGKLCHHFGHCERFAVLDIDQSTKTVLKREDIVPPPHEPGLLPPWLAERQVGLIIAGGMGQRALSIFTEHGIEVVVGAPSDTPETLVTDWMNGRLTCGANVCDH